MPTATVSGEGAAVVFVAVLVVVFGAPRVSIVTFWVMGSLEASLEASL